MKIIVTILASYLALTVNSRVWAAPSFADHFSEQIFNMDQTLLSTEQSQEESETMELKQFFLTVAPSFSFGVSSVLELTVSPQLTFEWEKVEP